MRRNIPDEGGYYNPKPVPWTRRLGNLWRPVLGGSTHRNCRHRRTPEEKFQRALYCMPPSGRGLGCHDAIMRAAFAGVEAGFQDYFILEEIRRHVPPGDREVGTGEIESLIRFARARTGTGSGAAPMKGSVDDQLVVPHATRVPRRPDQLNAIIEAGKGIGPEDIRQFSPVRIADDDLANSAILLEFLYDEDDLLFMGDAYDVEPWRIRTASNWKDVFCTVPWRPPHILPNPLIGQEVLNKSGRPSLRCDAAVARFPFAVAEFDDISLDDQAAFWASVDLPIAALIFSGGKSIHSLISVNCTDVQDWDRRVRGGLYRDFLVPLGVDPRCSNPSRLSRLCGHFRREKDQMQRLLYLARGGRRVR